MLYLKIPVSYCAPNFEVGKEQIKEALVHEFRLESWAFSKDDLAALTEFINIEAKPLSAETRFLCTNCGCDKFFAHKGGKVVCTGCYEQAVMV